MHIKFLMLNFLNLYKNPCLFRVTGRGAYSHSIIKLNKIPCRHLLVVLIPLMILWRRLRLLQHPPRPRDGLFHPEVLDHLEHADGRLGQLRVCLVVLLLLSVVVVAGSECLCGVPVVEAGQAVDVLLLLRRRGAAPGDVSVHGLRGIAAFSVQGT